MSTYGERLHDALLAASIDTREHAAFIAKSGGVSVRTAERYLRLQEADLSAKIAKRLARPLNVRVGWTIDGELPVRLTPEMLRAIALIERLSPDQTLRWLATGEWMAETGE